MEERYIPIIPVPKGIPSGVFKKSDIEPILAGAGFVDHTTKPLTQCIGTSFLTFTGSKANYHGGGWWSFSGYSQDKSDVTLVLERLGVSRVIE
jgi:hypothetical protein